MEKERINLLFKKRQLKEDLALGLAEMAFKAPTMTLSEALKEIGQDIRNIDIELTNAGV